MGFQINTNTAANTAYRNLSSTQNDMSKSLEKLSSGLRINRAADDAAGLAISEGLRSQIGGLGVAARNAQDGIGVIQTAEGALGEVHSILQRVRDLAVQAGNDSNNSDSRKAITTEVDGLVEELDRISQTTNFNGTKLLDGSNPSLSFQVGANGDQGNQIVVDLSADVETLAASLKSAPSGTRITVDAFATNGDATIAAGPHAFTSTNGGVTKAVTVTATAATSVEEYAAQLEANKDFSANFSVAVETNANGTGTGIIVTAKDGGVASYTTANGLTDKGAATTPPGGAGLDFSTAAGAKAAIATIDDKITSISTARAELGAVQNRFESAINSINVTQENLSAAKSRITDTDMAKEMADFTRSNILSQAGTAMLAQANQMNQGVLQLLR